MKDLRINFHGAIVTVRVPEQATERDAVIMMERFQDFQLAHRTRSCAIMYSKKRKQYRFITSAKAPWHKLRREEVLGYARAYNKPWRK